MRAWSSRLRLPGEEAYSLAILFEEEGASADSRFFSALDVSRARRLAKARDEPVLARGRCAAKRQPLARRYLQPHGSEFVLAERISRRVRFECLNLAQDVYPSSAGSVWGMDLILCRTGMLIYFDRDTIRDLACADCTIRWLPAAGCSRSASDPP